MSASLLSSKMLMSRGLTLTASSTASRSVRLAKPQPVRHASTYTYRLAAAAAPKGVPARPPKFGQDFWNYVSTQDNVDPPYLASRKRDSGEDAFFATTIGGSQHDVAFGLADGVGGWQESGVDPSVYSQALCGLMAGTAHLYEGHGSREKLRPKGLLQTAYEAVMSNPRIQAGGCTASLAVASADGTMEAANLGDSGFLVLSPGRVAYRSSPQTHAFNTPYQLSKIPARMQAQHAIFGGATHFSETPAQSDVSTHKLKHGDIVLFATDGVWDNLSAQDTLQVVTRVMEAGGYWSRSQGSETMLNTSSIDSIPATLDASTQDSYLPGQLARAVMREAKLAGLDRKRNGPFAKEVNQRYPHENWQGGKPDDIAVVVCVAVEDQPASREEQPIKAKL